MKAHHIEESAEDLGFDRLPPGETVVIASVHPASEASVDRVINASVEGRDGRSPWMWVRLRNGDLVLGVFPYGDTYCEVERDAQYRE